MSERKKDIVFVLPSLVAGGAERVISLIADSIDKAHFEVTLIVIGFEKDKAYNVEGINVVYLNKPRVLSGAPKLFGFIFKNRPHLVVSCMSHLNIIMALILIWFPRIKLVTREGLTANVKVSLKGYNLQGESTFTSDIIDN